MPLRIVTIMFAIIAVIAVIAASAARAETCTASWYSTESGSQTASGQRLSDGALTAAHKTLPIGSRVRVTNKSNGRSIVVTINDRGPFISGRCIDVTRAGKSALGMGGTAPVSIDRK